ncbi:putative membrane protein [Kitasatospora sp. MAP12-15]|uniref:vitamin K epoxide reductase family protein n=1 Tax=unclassified Kitasatospora TaxID=2633591 RepID=UPI00247624AC|nr:vitamin K epoxide reductase family protein [Kitasatospora sp. MAP12-44]MDH6109756.1 putative membrane protein [Kitasatospora sp. MAP12-44]
MRSETEAGTEAVVPARTAAAAPAAPSRGYAWVLCVAGAVGLAAAFVLTTDKIKLLQNPNYVPSCNINPIISCGSVMRTAQASVFGFPNSLLGLIGFAVVVATGVGVLGGARYRRWYWLGLQAGTVFGIVLIHWLIGQTLYSIGAVCPYCMVVWAATITLFWYTTLHNLRTGVIPVGRRLQPVVRELNRYHWVVPVLWYAGILLLVLNRFWSYWSTLI